MYYVAEALVTFTLISLVNQVSIGDCTPNLMKTKCLSFFVEAEKNFTFKMKIVQKIRVIEYQSK